MPKDETAFVVAIDDGRVSVTLLESGAVAPLTFTAKAADVEALQAGTLNLNVGFMQGRVKAAGDMKQLFELLPQAHS